MAHIMLLDDLLEPRIIELGEFCKVMDIGDDVVDVDFQKHKLPLGRPIVVCFWGVRDG